MNVWLLGRGRLVEDINVHRNWFCFKLIFWENLTGLISVLLGIEYFKFSN